MIWKWHWKKYSSLSLLKKFMGSDISNKSNGGTQRVKENGVILRSVSPDESGVGLPYAPENWPSPGDNWRWKVGKGVVITGHYLDRYVYLPKRLWGSGHNSRKKGGFASKLAVERYIKAAFPDADIDAFFASFSWKIPAKKSSKTTFRNAQVSGKEIITLPSVESREQSLDTGGCKAGNKMCNSLVEQTQNPPLVVMPCNICCSEPQFCRDCCCILCCKTINSTFGGCHHIKCEAVVGEGSICGHIAHIECALRSYMAGTVGGSIGLDAEYYCRRCDARTDLVSHVTRLLQTCEAIDSRDKIEKILNIGICLLRGSQKVSAKELHNRIEFIIAKLNCGTRLEDIWKVEDKLPDLSTDVSRDGNAALEITNHQDPLDIGTGLPDVSVSSSDFLAESQKLDEEIQQVLQELRKSQEFEYNLAEETLNSQKSYLCNLYQQLHKERTELARHVLSSTDQDDLLSAVLSRVEQIKGEVGKFKLMKEVAKGFGNTSRSILEEHFGLEIDSEVDQNP